MACGTVTETPVNADLKKSESKISRVELGGGIGVSFGGAQNFALIDHLSI